MKKIVSCLLALALLLGGTACAESLSGELMLAAEDLFLRTSNVTVTAEAQLRFDGEWFKTLHGSYKQDGYNSHLVWMLDTPRADGSVYTGGYTVTGLGTTAYVNETYDGNYYYEVPCNLADTLFTLSRQGQKAVSAAKSIVNAAEEVFHVLTIEPSANDENAVTVSLGDLPDMADAALWYLAVDYLWENYYLSLWNGQEDAYYGGVSLWYEDWQAIVAGMYRTLYGEELPEQIEDEVTEGRYYVAVNAADQIDNELRAQYDSGYVYVLADGSHEWFETLEECMRRAGEINVYYDDYRAALSACHEKLYGAPISEETWRTLVYSPSEELQSAMAELDQTLEKTYREAALEQNPDTVEVYVAADGTFRAYDKCRDYRYRYATVTQRIMYTTERIAVDSLQADVARDEEGRITAVRASGSFTVTDLEGEEHTLEIELDFTAGDYGVTSVNDVYDPQEYGFVSFEEFEREREENPDAEFDWYDFVQNAPETVEFMGETYETHFAEYLSE